MAGALSCIVHPLLLVLTVERGQRHFFRQKFLELKPKGRGTRDAWYTLGAYENML